ncbi:glycerol ABC transporter substrate-binding protein [Halorussus sp. JP-T4]|nr:glycerol ABC transporter substrate-binding protein [Halorussus sp. JP-T4]
MKVALALLALLGLAYSLLIATQPLLGVLFVVWIAGFYLLWRFLHLAERLVRAIERIADGTEGRNRAGRENRRERDGRDREREF